MRDDWLRTLVERAQCDPALWSELELRASGILHRIGIDRRLARSWLASTFSEKEILDLYAVEAAAHAELERMLAPHDTTADALREYHGERFNTLRPYLRKGATTLDVGAGSGIIAQKIDSYGCPCTIADALNWSKVPLPYLQVRDNRIDAPDNSFEQVLSYACFHHSDDPVALLREVTRVADKRIIFVESVASTEREFLYTSWMDWFCNRVTFHYAESPEQKIAVPCEFKSPHGWETAMLDVSRLTPTISEHLGMRQEFAPLHHHLFVYDKQ
jgi:SAM-dependent methyltransferase